MGEQNAILSNELLWNRELQTQQMNQATSHACESYNIEDLLNFRNSQRRHERFIRSSEPNFFRTCCKELENERVARRLYRLLKSDESAQLHYLIKPDGTHEL